MFDNSVVYKVVLGGDDGPEHVGYPGGIEDDQILQCQVAAIRVSREVQYDAQIMHELQCGWDVGYCYTALLWRTC